MNEAIIDCPVCGEKYSTDYYILKSDYDECNIEMLGYKQAEQDVIAERNELTRQNRILREALEMEKHSLEESGAYLVEIGFEEPEHCLRFRKICEALKSCEALKAGG